MFIYKRFVVAQHERGFLFRDGRLVQMLEPGAYRFFDPLGRIGVERYDLGRPAWSNKNAEVLMKTSGELLQPYLQRVAIDEHEIGLIYRDDKLAEVLAPAERKVYWKIPYTLRVERVDVRTELRVPRELIDLMLRARNGSVAGELSPFVHGIEIMDQWVGLLIVDGEFVQALEPGFHAFWAVKRHVVVEQLDTRVQAMEVQGQEILSRDKVSLRLNLAAQYQVADPLKARTRLQSPLDWLYRELQFALRQSVGGRDLDKLLEDKERVDREVFDKVAGKAAENGFVLHSVGLKDVILPGEMKDILNQVVQADKAAQANVIKRREETAATRSLLNTAKLMEDNPTLLRLKELETLEKVTDKVDRLTVFGGLDGVLNDTVKISV